MDRHNAAQVPRLSTAIVPLAKTDNAARMPHMSNDLYQRIKQRLEEIGMSENDASLAVTKTNRDLLRNLKRGRSVELKGDQLLKMAALLGVSARWLQTGEKDHISSEEVAATLGNTTEAPEHSGTSALKNYSGSVAGAIPEVDARAGAGNGSIGEEAVVTLQRGEAYVGQKVISEWVFPPSFVRHELRLQPGQIMVLEVVGDSMSPTLQSGDRIIVDTAHSVPNPDGIYVIDEGDGPRVKRIQLVRRSEPAEMRVMSDNKNHEAYTLRVDEVRIIGRVSGRVTRM